MSKLNIEINSFSYKSGYPKDNTGNGGGFVFDCRGIQNPGRIDAYKTLTGLDSSVKTYLQNETEMIHFLEHIFKTLDIPIENYLSRDFSHLQINYGCTGGQHRSVYAAEATAEYLADKYENINLKVNHTNKNNWRQ